MNNRGRRASIHLLNVHYRVVWILGLVKQPCLHSGGCLDLGGQHPPHDAKLGALSDMKPVHGSPPNWIKMISLPNRSQASLPD
jgi:hypothetical protein